MNVYSFHVQPQIATGSLYGVESNLNLRRVLRKPTDNAKSVKRKAQSDAQRKAQSGAQPAVQPGPGSLQSDQATTSGQPVVQNPTPGKAHRTAPGTTTPSRKRKRSVTDADADANPNPRPTKLRASKPVQAVVAGDMWNTIFAVSHPATLLTCHKLRHFSPLLDGHPKVWEQSRISTHGDDIPAPLPGLSEENYADLRELKGCHMPGCTDKKARKAYWAFCRRWCKHHLQEQTIKRPDAVAQIKDFIGDHPVEIQEILRSLTAASLDSWGNYAGAGESPFRFSTNIYSRKELASLCEKFNDAFPVLPVTDTAALDAWFAAEQAVAASRVEWAKRLEGAYKDSATATRTANAALKKARVDFFTERAAAMDPPRSVADLQKIPAYTRAIQITRAPTESAWTYLRKHLG